MWLKFDTTGVGWLVTEDGILGLTATEFSLFNRILGSNQAINAVTPSSDPLLPAQFATVKDVLARLRAANPDSNVPTVGNLTSALNSTVNLVNAHADANKNAIIAEIDSH